MTPLVVLISLLFPKSLSKASHFFDRLNPFDPLSLIRICRLRHVSSTYSSPLYRLFISTHFIRGLGLKSRQDAVYYKQLTTRSRSVRETIEVLKKRHEKQQIKQLTTEVEVNSKRYPEFE